MKFGKKGTESEFWPADTLLFWLIFGIVLAFVAITFVFIISKSGAEKARIYYNLESLNIMQRFFKSQNCFVYEKEGITLYNVIDYNKFNEQRLNGCYAWPNINQNIFLAFKINLKSDAANIANSIKTSNWNDNRPFEQKEFPRNVLIYADNKFQNGVMEIETQNII